MPPTKEKLKQALEALEESQKYLVGTSYEEHSCYDFLKMVLTRAINRPE